MNTILGTKSHMSQAFTPEGTRVPVSVVKSGPNVVTQVKREEKDGYWALQLGFGQKKIKNITKPLRGHLSKARQQTTNGRQREATLPAQQTTLPRYLREVKIQEESEYKVGDTIEPQNVLKPGDLVQVTGVSKGKGFAGVVKRWGFAGGPRTHGQSDRERAPGSIGQGTTPGRVFKGKKMPGRMGGEQRTVKNLTVLAVNEETGEILLSGPVPGGRGTLLLIRKVQGRARVGEEKEQNGSKNA